MTKHANTQYPVLPLIKERWSPRSFSDRALKEEDLLTMLEAGTWAFSANNEQPWRFVFALRGTPEFDQLHDVLMPGNQPWAKNAAALVISCYKEFFTANGNPNGIALHDVGAANSLIALQGQSMGVHTHVMGGFDREKAKALLPAEEKVIPAVMLAFGYLDAPEKLEGGFLERELAPRTRKPLSEIVLSL